MKLTLVARPPSDTNLTLLRQLGIVHAVHYDMADLPDDFEALSAIRDRYRRHGLAWKIAESGPAIDRIVMGKEGARGQTERYARIVRHLGRLGVEVVAYNFMPQVSEDAMVARTSFGMPTRGGALTSAFRLADFHDGMIAHEEVPIPREQMWDNLERFLRAVLPSAEDAGVRLAMHPDDPPMPELCGLSRIMGSVEDFERLLALSGSQANALTFCIGCFAERGYDIPSLARRFAPRTAFLHIRDIRGSLEDFHETFPDDGQTDLAAVLRAFVSAGFEGYARSDHAPRLATETAPEHDGYGMQGHIFGIGYLRGLLHAIEREPGP
ncbi:MAG: mannonate dehydratase [Microvirga sp.]